MSAPTTDPLRLTSPVDLVAIVPYLLGFAPTDSIVVIVFQGETIKRTARVDSVHSVSQAASLAQGIQHAEGDSVVIAAYADGVDDAAHDLEDFAAALAETVTSPVEILSKVAVGTVEDAYRDLATGETGVHSELRWRPAVVEMVGRGLAPAPSRESIEARIAPGSEALPEGFARGFAHAMSRIATWDPQNVAQALRDGLAELLGQPDPDGRSLGLLAALTTTDPGRLAALRELNPETAPMHVELWSRLARITDGHAALAPLMLAGLSGWLSGDGVLLNAAGDAMDAILGQDDPERWMLSTIGFIVSNCYPPRGWAMLCEKVHEVYARHAEQMEAGR